MFVYRRGFEFFFPKLLSFNPFSRAFIYVVEEKKWGDRFHLGNKSNSRDIFIWKWLWSRSLHDLVSRFDLLFLPNHRFILVRLRNTIYLTKNPPCFEFSSDSKRLFIINYHRFRRFNFFAFVKVGNLNQEK